jgi:cytoskeletal protein CcmA (bactofilin family)
MRDVFRGEGDTEASFLGASVAVRGVLEVDGELIVAGVVRGYIAARKLVIAASGTIEGDVVAREVIIAGRLIGRVFAPTVFIENCAWIEGRVFHTEITVVNGAHVDGRMPWRPISYFENLEKLPEHRL